MSIAKLNGLPKGTNYSAETVDRVKDLLNAGEVDVDDVAQYFSVDKALIIQSLTGIAPDAYTQDTKNLTGLSVDNVNAVERLIQTGVASTGDIAEYFNAPAPVIERHLEDVRGYNQTAIATAQAGMAVQDENRFASYQSEFGNDEIMNITDPANATVISGEVQRKRLTPEELRAEAANVLNRAQSPSEIAKGMRNLTTFAANPTGEVLSAITAVSGVPASAGLTQDRAWADFEFRPRMRPYFGPEGQTAGGPQLVTGRSAEATIAENTGVKTAGTGETTNLLSSDGLMSEDQVNNFNESLRTNDPSSFDSPLAQMAAQQNQMGVNDLDALAGRGYNLAPVATTQYQTGSEIPTGLRGSEMALKGGATGAIDMLDMLNRASRQELSNQYALGLEQAGARAADASGFIQPYQQAGETALQQQMALSGALGQDAFDQAYQESPQMAFLREQGMRANLAGAGATGGLGGGNIQKELQRFGQGLASQGLQNQISNLSGLSSMGQNAAGAMANIQTGLGTQQLQGQQALGNQLSNQLTTYGLPAAQQIGNLGINLATGRTVAGQQLANQYGGAAANLADIYSNQGGNLASMLGGQRNLLMDQYNNAALNEARAQQGYGADMSNIQSGIGSSIAGVPQAQINVPNYQAATQNAFNAGALGYGMIKDANSNATQPTTGAFQFGAGFQPGYFNQPTTGFMPPPTTAGMPNTTIVPA